MRSRPPLTAMAWLRWDAIDRCLVSVVPRAVLEVGAGQGAMGVRLADRCDRYVGVEPDSASATVARERLDQSGTLVEGSVDELPAELRVDLVCAFEVLEHIDDDAGALVAWRDRLPEGGSLLLSVPADATRFGPSDRLVGHFRRYDRSDLEELLPSAGFRIERIEPYGFGLGHLLEWTRNRVIERRSPSTDEVGTSGSGRLFQPSAALGLVTWAAALPGRVLQKVAGRRPGVGWVVLATRVDAAG